MPLSLYSYRGGTPITITPKKQDQFGLVLAENVSRHQIEPKVSASIFVSSEHVYSDEYLDSERKRLQEFNIREGAGASLPGALIPMNGFALIIVLVGSLFITLLCLLCKPFLNKKKSIPVWKS